MARISRTDLPGVVLLTTTGSLDAATAVDWQSIAVVAVIGQLRS
ncbi:hypothetical protein ACFWN2_01985 [Lentzea sp. NPDC058436]